MVRTLSRRTVLLGAVRLSLTAALGRADADTRRKLKVVVTGGHPGDPEYGCGGTITRYTDAGHEVVLLYLNRGEKTCPEPAQQNGDSLRVAEAKRACEILKSRALFAGQCDAHAVVDREHYLAFGDLIRSERPDVLFTHWPIDGHADHRAISMLTYDAWLKMGKKCGFFYYEVSNGEDTLMFSPTDFVDITSNEPRKRAACFTHASQAPEKFYALQSQVSRFRGIESGHVHAEAFVRHVQSPSGLLP